MSDEVVVNEVAPQGISFHEGRDQPLAPPTTPPSHAPGDEASALITIKALHDLVKTQLAGIAPAGSLVDYSEGNHVGTYPEGYLWDTPHGYWYGGAFVPTNHSDAFAAKVEKLIAEAQTLVDITTMKVPTGKFWQAIKSGLRQVAERKQRVNARIAIGFPIHWTPPNLWHFLEEIAKELKNHRDYVTVDLGIYRCWPGQSYPEGWNHTKILAVDGKKLLNGGHNLWSDDYLGPTPVFDLSMQVDGRIASGGHAFASRLWQYISSNRNAQTYSHRMRQDLTIGDDPPLVSINLPPVGPVGSIPAMWVANTGRRMFWNQTTGKELIVSTMIIAFLEALKTAEHCRIAQQSFGSLPMRHHGKPFEVYNHGDAMPFGLIHHQNQKTGEWHAFNNEIIKGLAEFLYRRRQSDKFVLEILMSPPDGGSYTNGEAEAAILDLLVHRVYELFTPTKPSRSEMVNLLNRLVKLNWPAITSEQGVPVREWVHHKKPMVTHAKFWAMDNRLFYVGSENMYPAIAASTLTANALGGLQEFGVILESNGLHGLLVQQYHERAMGLGYRRLLAESDLTSPYFGVTASAQ